MPDGGSVLIEVHNVTSLAKSLAAKQRKGKRVPIDLELELESAAKYLAHICESEWEEVPGEANTYRRKSA